MMYKTIDEIKEANRAHGHYFFEPDTMRFFNSRISPTVYGGRYFITSERQDDNHKRLYTIRVAHADGSIDTVGDFQGYATHGKARVAAQMLGWRRGQWTPDTREEAMGDA